MKKQFAFLFDMDGTMMDNMQYHLQAWETTVADAGSDMKGAALFSQLYGKNTEILTRVLGTERYDPEQIRNIALIKDELYRRTYAPHIKLIDGFKDFIESAKAQQVLMAIATGTVTKNVEFALTHLQLKTYFDAIVSGSDVKLSKPDPDTFMQAAERLKVLPKDCIVFEDVPMGVESARRAGMKSVVILTSHKKEEFKDYPNVLQIIPDYKDLHVEELLYLVSRD